MNNNEKILNSALLFFNSVYDGEYDKISKALHFAEIFNNALTLEADIDEALKFFLINNAIPASTKRTSFKREERYLKDHVADVLNYVKPYFVSLRNGDFVQQAIHNIAFLNCSLDLCRWFNNLHRTQMKFGNAQKIINIVTKCLMVGAYFKHHESFQSRYVYVHVPMDSIMLNKTFRWFENDIRNITDYYGNTLYRTKDDWVGNNSKAIPTWPDIDFEDGYFPQRYLDYQQCFANYKIGNKIEIDLMEW